MDLLDSRQGEDETRRTEPPKKHTEHTFHRRPTDLLGSPRPAVHADGEGPSNIPTWSERHPLLFGCGLVYSVYLTLKRPFRRSVIGLKMGLRWDAHSEALKRVAYRTLKLPEYRQSFPDPRMRRRVDSLNAFVERSEREEGRLPGLLSTMWNARSISQKSAGERGSVLEEVEQKHADDWYVQKREAAIGRLREIAEEEYHAALNRIKEQMEFADKIYTSAQESAKRKNKMKD